MTSNPPPLPRAPAAREKLQAAEAVRADLECEVAALALEASEGKAGAEKALAAHRAKIDAAARQVTELRAAVTLAEFLDREAAATSAACMRAEQFEAFGTAMRDREKAMADVLEAGGVMAAAYGRLSEATLAAMNAIPSGTSVPVMAMGPNGHYGPAFGPCWMLIIAELYRLGPARADGAGRFILPFARPPTEMDRYQPEAIPPGLEEFKAANRMIITDIETQVARLNQRAMEAAREAA